jgi:alpha-tubulin suppressor-like RCC1 family protein
VPGLTGIVAAEAGVACSFAVRGDGTLLTWGINSGNGKLGTTPLSFFEERASWGPHSSVPVPLAVPFEAIDVSTMRDHTLALTRDARVYAWGSGDKGQLGIGPMPVIKFRYETPSAYPYAPFPIQIAGLSGVLAISAGFAHSLAVMKDGTVRAWGENRWGEVGDGTTAGRNAPVVVPAVKDAVGVAAGQGFSAAVLRDGSVMTWGNRLHGALGRTPDADNRADPVPARVPGVQGVRTIVAGHSHVLALTEGGTVISWGMPDFGQTGRPGASNPAPGPIPGLSGVQSIAAHENTSMAVLASGRIMTWGFNVRPWTRPPEEGSYANISHRPILLWLDGLEQP